MLIGHQQQLDYVVTAATHGKLAQAYLITGQPGVGKATFACTLAQRLCCPKPVAAYPCGVCTSCLQLAAHTHPDLTWVAALPPKTEVSIDQVRELRSFTNLASLSGGKRLVVLDGADTLTAEAANALLKTLEEPLGQALFLLLASDLRQVPPTVRSRCQLLSLGIVPTNAIAAALQQGMPAAEAELLAQESGGYPGKALALANDQELRAAHAAQVSLLLTILRARGWPELQHFAERELSGGDEGERASTKALQVIGVWLELARDLVLLSLGLSHLARYQNQRDELELVARTLGTVKLRDACTAILQARHSLIANANVRLTMETLALSLAHL